MLTSEGDIYILVFVDLSTVPRLYMQRKLYIISFRTLFGALNLLPFEVTDSLSSNLWSPGYLNSFSLQPLVEQVQS